MTRELESYLNNSNAGEMLWEIAVSLEILLFICSTTL